MSVYLTDKSPFYQFRVTVNGKRIQESTGCTNKKAAEKFEDVRKAEVAGGGFQKPEKLTLEEFGERYMDYAKATKRSWLRDEQLMKHLNEAFGSIQLGAITVFPIEKYRARRREAVSPATVNREVALLKHLFFKAEEWGMFRGRNPVKGMRQLDENVKLRVLSYDEEAKLASFCGPRLRELMTFSLNSGLRLGDMLSLTWKEVFLDEEVPVLRKAMQKSRKHRVVEVPLNEAAMKVIGSRQAQRIDDCEYIFFHPETGTKWKDVWHGFKKACRAAGLGDVTWHTLRHTVATRVLQNGTDLVTVKELLGHSDIKTTIGYTHLGKTAKAVGMGSLDSRKGGAGAQ
jgi:integrase